MLVIYIDKHTNRLGYTLNFIFKDVLKIDYMVTLSKETFIAEKGAKLSYSEEAVYDELHLTHSNLLFETDITNFDLNYFEKDGVPFLFRTCTQDDILDFDVFAAVFYMISRYEEYLPFIADKHGRFSSEDSLAVEHNFLEKPVVNIWIDMLKNKILEKYPNEVFMQKKFSFLNSIDVDMAYYYKGKGLYRSIGGFLRDLIKRDFTSCKERIKIDFFGKEDPYNCFAFLQNHICKNSLKTLIFYLMAPSSDYDKSISPYNTNFQLSIKDMADYADIGIHPSYYVCEEPDRLPSQIQLLKDIVHKNITDARFHYLRFRLPDSYNTLMENEITDDYSMGYSDRIGFRAGTCSSFQFYDLEKDCETKLRVHPFAFMDVALKNGLHLSPLQAFEKIKNIVDEVYKVKGELISVWHNESLSDYKDWQGWRNVYEQQTEYITQLKQKEK